MSIDKDFDWIPYQENEFIYEEIVVNKIYEKFFSVEKDDIVVDIGANIGIFTAHIIDKQPKIVHCVEPTKTVYDYLERNTKKYSNVIAHHSAISDHNKYYAPFFGELPHSKEHEVMSFKEFCEQNNLNHIDFLKIDCEGCEFSILTQDNIFYIANKVNKIVAEIHLWNNENWMKSASLFRQFLSDAGGILLDVHNQNVTQQFIYDPYYLIHYNRTEKHPQFMYYYQK